jgi:hypothetical protein
MYRHGVIEYKSEVGEIDYLSTLSKVVLALYFDVVLAKRELLFFVLVLYCLRRGEEDVSSKAFKEVFDMHYFKEDQTNPQKSSLFCTVRKNLIKKKLIFYNKNTGSIKVSKAWEHNTNTININIGLKITN